MNSAVTGILEIPEKPHSPSRTHRLVDDTTRLQLFLEINPASHLDNEIISIVLDNPVIQAKDILERIPELFHPAEPLDRELVSEDELLSVDSICAAPPFDDRHWGVILGVVFVGLVDLDGGYGDDSRGPWGLYRRPLRRKAVNVDESAVHLPEELMTRASMSVLIRELRDSQDTAVAE